MKRDVHLPDEWEKDVFIPFKKGIIDNAGGIVAFLTATSVLVSVSYTMGYVSVFGFELIQLYTIQDFLAQSLSWSPVVIGALLLMIALIGIVVLNGKQINQETRINIRKGGEKEERQTSIIFKALDVVTISFVVLLLVEILIYPDNIILTVVALIASYGSGIIFRNWFDESSRYIVFGMLSVTLLVFVTLSFVMGNSAALSIKNDRGERVDIILTGSQGILKKAKMVSSLHNVMLIVDADKRLRLINQSEIQQIILETPVSGEKRGLICWMFRVSCAK